MCFKRKNKILPEPEIEGGSCCVSTKNASSKKSKQNKSANNGDINYRNYHVVKREDGKWEVKFAGGQKAIKLFDNQVDAVEYAKVMAKNQEGSVLVHNSKGKNKGRIKSK